MNSVRYSILNQSLFTFSLGMKTKTRPAVKVPQLLVLLLLACKSNAEYKDKIFSIKCQTVIRKGFVYEVSLKNASLIKMTGGATIQIRYNAKKNWRNALCSKEKYLPRKCVLSSFERSRPRFGELRLVNSKNETIFKTNETFFRYQENYGCYKEHGFKSLNILSENIDSIALSYELYEHDIKYFVESERPLLVKYHRVIGHPEENITIYTDGIMKGSNHEIIPNLETCQKYQICVEILLIPQITHLFETTRCLQASTYCRKLHIVEIKEKDYTPVYALGATMVVIFVFVAIFVKKRYSKHKNYPNVHGQREECGAGLPPPLPKRPKHLQTRGERLLRIIVKANKQKWTKRSGERDDRQQLDSVCVIDEDHLRLSLSNHDCALKHLYTSVLYVATPAEIAAFKEKQFESNEEESLTSNIQDSSNCDSEASEIYDSQTCSGSSLCDVYTSDSGDYNIY